MNQKIQKICWAALGVVAFVLIFTIWDYFFSPLFSFLSVFVPMPIYLLVAFFFTMFLCRETAAFVFMPKPRLKAILRNGEIENSASNTLRNLFSWPFLKRISVYFLLFIAEMTCRLVSIRWFLDFFAWTNDLWASALEASTFLTVALWIVIGYVIMELPWYLLFYKFSFKGHSNRSAEYRFGIKAFIFVLLIYAIQTAFYPLSLRSDNSWYQLMLIAIVCALSLGLWYLMYAKKCRCGCPICTGLRKLSGSDDDNAESCAIKVAQSILDAQGEEIAKTENDIVQSVVKGEKIKEQEDAKKHENKE